ncbi:MAG: dihydropteroate synthase [Planctomycetaceae bacterium]
MPSDQSLTSHHALAHDWLLPCGRWWPTAIPRLMGILNCTPDSFSDGGQFAQIDAAVAHGIALAEAGADVIDVGGESTRPGAVPVPAGEELGRVIPVIERLVERVTVPISIDTTKGLVARSALDCGATIVNDISAGAIDPDLIAATAESNCGVILMHMQGTPQTMQREPRYNDVVTEVRDHLAERILAFEAAGVDRARIMLDPGIGFGKTAAHNVELLTSIAALRQLGRPVLIGHSRKRFLYHLLGRETDERLAGTIGSSIALAAQGVDMLRVHDVAAVRDALRAWRALSSVQP